MPWTIERTHNQVAVVTMNTNKVNAQDPAFFADLHAAFDRLESEFNDCAVVLTGTGAVFSAATNFQTMSGPPSVRCCRTRHAACHGWMIGAC
jgi:enoyl-CoA hydratase